MPRLKADFVFGTIDTALTAAGTVLSSPALVRLPAVTGTDTAAVTLFDATAGTYEIVWVTAHTAAATTATIARGKESSTAAAWASGASWAHAPTSLDYGAGGVLACTAYNPGTLTAYNRLSGAQVDLDATNVAATFTAPASGRVLVRLSALGGTSNGGTMLWNVREGAADLTTPMQIANLSTNNVWTATATVSGLVPGSIHTYKFGFGTLSGGTQVNIYAGGSAANAPTPGHPAVVEIHALP